MNKKYFLEKWLKVHGAISLQMMELFIKNNAKSLDLSSLPKSDKEKWYELDSKQQRINDQMKKIILGK